MLRLLLWAWTKGAAAVTEYVIFGTARSVATAIEARDLNTRIDARDISRAVEVQVMEVPRG